MRDLPSRTVTFLFTDIEGSTRLLHELGPEAYAKALEEHRQLVRAASTRHGGVEVDGVTPRRSPQSRQPPQPRDARARSGAHDRRRSALVCLLCEPPDRP